MRGRISGNRYTFFKLFDFSTHHDLLRRENSFLELAYRRSLSEENADAKRHLFEGFYRRFNMMQLARVYLYTQSEEHGDRPLGLRAIHFSIYLNSFYSNLVGAFDNLAWALTYKYELITPVVEAGGRGSSRRFCNLFGSQFLSKLEEIDSLVPVLLEAKIEWIEDLKSLRDPGAHRIPPFFVGTVLNEKQAAAVKLLWEQAEAVISEANPPPTGDPIKDFDNSIDKTHRYLDLMNESLTIGGFQPLVQSIDADKHRLLWAPDLIENDQNTFLEIGQAVLTKLF